MKLLRLRPYETTSPEKYKVAVSTAAFSCSGKQYGGPDDRNVGRLFGAKLWSWATFVFITGGRIAIKFAVDIHCPQTVNDDGYGFPLAPSSDHTLKFVKDVSKLNAQKCFKETGWTDSCSCKYNPLILKKWPHDLYFSATHGTYFTVLQLVRLYDVVVCFWCHTTYWTLYCGVCWTL